MTCSTSAVTPTSVHPSIFSSPTCRRSSSCLPGSSPQYIIRGTPHTHTHTRIPPEKVRRSWRAKASWRARSGAASSGTVTPFCSCSAVPMFIGFLESGLPLGVTFAFLIASPVVNEVALVMLAGLFGLKIALCTWAWASWWPSWVAR